MPPGPRDLNKYLHDTFAITYPHPIPTSHSFVQLIMEVEVTPILKVLRPPQNLQDRRVCVLYAKTPKSEVLHPPQKLQNRKFCVVLKILLIIFNTPKSEVLHTLRKNSKIGGFAPTAKTPKSEVLRSFENIINNIWYSNIGGSAYYTQKLQNRRFCAHRNSKIGGSAYFMQKLQNRRFCAHPKYYKIGRFA